MRLQNKGRIPRLDPFQKEEGCERGRKLYIDLGNFDTLLETLKILYPLRTGS